MRYRSTKQEKFDSIYRSYSNDIYRVCLYLLKNEQLAQEIMQQTFLICYDDFENVASDCVFAYLVCTAKELAYNRQSNCENG